LDSSRTLGSKIATTAIKAAPGGLPAILGPAFTILSTPTEGAKEPLDTPYGFARSNYYADHVDPYIRGDAVGPAPDYQTSERNFNTGYNELMDRVAEETRRKEEEEKKRAAIANRKTTGDVVASALLRTITGLF
jgi:hypothetical protein